MAIVSMPFILSVKVLWVNVLQYMEQDFQRKAYDIEYAQAKQIRQYMFFNYFVFIK